MVEAVCLNPNIICRPAYINANQPKALAIYYCRGTGHWPFILYLEKAEVPGVYSWMSLNCSCRDGWGSGVGKEKNCRKVDDEEWRVSDSRELKSKTKREKEKKLRRCRPKHDTIIDSSKQNEDKPDWCTSVRSIQWLIHWQNKAKQQWPETICL